MIVGERRLDVRLLDTPVQMLEFDPPPRGSGGECVFVGRTRLEDHPDHGPLRCLHYDAYRPMAERVLRDLAIQASADFGCHAVRVHHALGPVRIGEASILVQVLTGHRAEAFSACRFLIDTVKTSAPIWKREEWSGGTTWSTGTPVPRHEREGGP